MAKPKQFNLFKFIIKNIISIGLGIALTITLSYYFYLENQYLKERNSLLVKENLELLERTKELNKQIKIFKDELNQANAEFERNLKNFEKLTPAEKQRNILYLIRKILRLRGIK